ncbi:MotA/TolQ/ExbB proton channel family protein [Methanobrevibacter cuticularis]|uniref:MotA/TolQ/ExbB proton channel family protein n=1 Tax=Methanobrevibacter cuticularis TaxID=47311 RepID=A0A166D456_9EURY|nr:MotA/TolQ/ExbB proton channel family protein [Methanobrevibacter cuticularis]KZX15184.1 MotA/TolQ/ExbB proton channel family protein [Methanobrevibacter cuticularis]
MEILGSEILTSLLHAISQTLLIPVIILLLIFVIFTLVSVGGIISEYKSRKKLKLNEIESLIKSINTTNTYHEMEDTINNSDIGESYKIAILKIIENHDFGIETRKAFAAKIIEEEELKMEKSVEKTDIIVRIGPTVGLMGTLIPMGPGLASLGAGNIELLAQAIIVAFDTTVTGLAAAAVAYIISRVRKRWYEEDLSNFEVLISSTLEILEKKA